MSAELTTHHHDNNGFFSNCSIRLDSIVKFFNVNKRFPISVNSSSQFQTYKINSHDCNENICDQLFNTDLSINYEFTNEVDYHHDKQWSKYYRLQYEKITPFINRYFKPTQIVQDNIQSLKNKYQIDYNKTIAVYYRGNDKIKENPLGSYETFIKKCHELAEQYKDFSFLIQTDELQFLQACLADVKNSFYIQEMPVISKDIRTAVHHHIPKLARPQFALNIISVANIIANCHAIINHTGNCGVWINLLRGNCNNVYQYLKDTNNNGWYSHLNLNENGDSNSLISD